MLKSARSCSPIPVPEAEQVVDLVDRFALRVQAVQLDILECGLDLGPLLLELR